MRIDQDSGREGAGISGLQVRGETEVTIVHSGFGENGVPDAADNYALGTREIMASLRDWLEKDG